jgi:uncharacterized protein YeaO (DUF488 family)
MKGKIITCSLSKMKDYEADLKYFIVRKPGRVKADGMVHRADLSPSYDLFAWTQMHKQEEGWFSKYTKRFVYEMQNRPDLIAALNEIQKASETQNVMLVCFCGDVNECHRGLIADELLSRGVDVIKG